MGRKVLMKGDTINGEFLYEIESVSGTGASCIVYKAWYKEDNNSEPHCVQLKELYPYDVGLFRDASNNLICKTDDDKKKFDEYKKNFEASNNMLVKLNRLTDSTPREIQSFSYNGTIYSIVAYNNGKQYSEEKLQAIDLGSLLQIVKSLTISVSRLHEEGYLHLDIKPDNFLINDIGGAILFDVDSVVPVDKIKYRKGISYSKKWAAPEVKYAAKKSDYKDISCKSDIFSIGVILFEAIMGRDFLPMETVSYNRNWDIENSVKLREEKQNRKVNINPKFYHKIREILEKTLDRNPSKRYNSAQELYDNLAEARDLLEEKPWIIPSDRTVTPQFTGRKSELSKMNSILQKENTVFLHGFGGIGKSELALKYAEVYKDDFDTVVFCKYENSIKEALLNIRIANYPKDSNTMYLQKVAELCDERTLIILDNFDVDTDADDYLDDFINNYNCKKIITTKTDFSELYTQLDVEALRQDDAILLFEKESKLIPKTEDEEKTLNEILKLIGYHTYFTVILAKKKEMFSLSIDELKKQTEEMLLKKSGKVTVAKDGKLTTATIYAMAEKLFDFETISESEEQTLRNLYMLSWRTVSRNDYTKIAGYGMSDEDKIELIDSLNDLTRLGWVLYDEKSDDFYLHPIMQELVIKKLCEEPNDNCSVVKYYRISIDDFIKRPSIYEGVQQKSVYTDVRFCNSYYFCTKLQDNIMFYNKLIKMSSKNALYIFKILDCCLYCQEKHSDAIDYNYDKLISLVEKLKNCLFHNHTIFIKLTGLTLMFELYKYLYERKNMYECLDIYNQYIELYKRMKIDDKESYWYIVNPLIKIRAKTFSTEECSLLAQEKFQQILSCVENIRHALNTEDIELYDQCKSNFNKKCELETNKRDRQVSQSNEKNFCKSDSVLSTYLDMLFYKVDTAQEWFSILTNDSSLEKHQKESLIFEICEICAIYINRYLTNETSGALEKYADVILMSNHEFLDYALIPASLVYAYTNEEKCDCIMQKFLNKIVYKNIEDLRPENIEVSDNSLLNILYDRYEEKKLTHKIFSSVYKSVMNIISLLQNKNEDPSELYYLIIHIAELSYKETTEKQYSEVIKDCKNKLNKLTGRNYNTKE